MKQHLNTTDKELGKISWQKAGKGPAVVLIHGLTDTSEVWHRVMPTLAGNYTVIAPDLPGVGGSEYAGGELTIEMMAETVRIIMEKEGVTSAVIVGHSMGGYTALAFAEKYPEMVNGLSLVHSQAFEDTEERKEIRRKSVELIKKGGKEQLLRTMTPNLFAGSFKKQHPEQMEKIIGETIKMNDESLIRFYKAMIKRPDRTNVLKTAVFPVQWIVGEEDSLIPMETVTKQCHLAKVNFIKLYEHCGHMSMIENPERLMNDLNGFFRYCFEPLQ